MWMPASTVKTVLHGNAASTDAGAGNDAPLEAETFPECSDNKIDCTSSTTEDASMSTMTATEKELHEFFTELYRPMLGFSDSVNGNAAAVDASSASVHSNGIEEDYYGYEEEEEEELFFGPYADKDFGVKDYDIDDDGDDLRSFASFSSLSVDTIHPFDELIVGSSHVISPGSTGADNSIDTNHTIGGRTPASPTIPSISATKVGATRLWNNLQNQISKIPSIPILLNGPSHHKDKRGDESCPCKVKDDSGSYFPHAGSRRNDEYEHRSISIGTVTSIDANVVRETLQSWMNNSKPTMSMVEPNEGALRETLERGEDVGIGLGDGLDMPSASLHKVSNHSDEFSAFPISRSNRDQQCEYGVPQPTDHATSQEAEHPIPQRRPFAFLSFSSNTSSMFNESLDSSSIERLRSVSPLPWITTTSNDNIKDDYDFDDDDDDIQEFEGTSVTAGQSGADDDMSLDLDLFDPDDDLDLVFNNTEFLPLNDEERVYHDRGGKDDTVVNAGTHAAKNNSVNVTVHGCKPTFEDKFSRLRHLRTAIPRACSLSSSDDEDSHKQHVDSGSVDSSWSQEEDASEFVETSDTSSDDFSSSSDSLNGQRLVELSRSGARDRRKRAPSKSGKAMKDKEDTLSDDDECTSSLCGASHQTAKRIRKEEPLIKKYVEPTDRDVLLGRGGRSNHHPGNKVYRERVLALQAQYKTLSRDGKTAMSRSVVEWIQNVRGGTFLQYDVGGNSQDGPWYVVLDKTARSKVSQALREDHTVEGRAAKHARRRRGTNSGSRGSRQQKKKTLRFDIEFSKESQVCHSFVHV